ncbi:MAG TPA: tRNA (adenosine(37)-N6)-dimethylallyltransferase MiaA [Candidatus Rifleibacterium sp.]|nr:tRNA (adenosine(37)-N6)-dimethylallyltransferase MiaA [Candidatus Rifleibacterium sp.]
MQKPVLAVLGPTASGKTALAIEIARRCDGEIVNCDSRQVYRGMQIGTASPSPEELQQVPHHLFNFLSPAENFSAADYALKAAEVCREIWGRKKIPLLTGGTGFYYAAIAEGLGDAGQNLQRAEELRKLLENRGLEYMVSMLQQLDPAAAAGIDTNNSRRVLRAIEIVETTGKPYAENRPVSLLTEADFFPVVVTRAREELHRSIALRVDKMIADGLEAEVRQLVSKFGQQAPGLNSIGYQEWFANFNGAMTVAQVKELIIIHTRQYAKRQETWFRRRPGVAPVDIGSQQDPAAIFQQIAAFVGQFAL